MNDTPPITLTTHSIAETMAVGRAIASVVQPGDVIGLIGELGAGKTQLVRGLVGALGIDERAVCSPTFVLMQEYAATLPVLHIDAYRMESLADLESTGWSAALADEAISVIEWADRVAEDLPDDRLDVRLGHGGEHERELRLTARGAWAERMGAVAQRLAPLAETAPQPATQCPICHSPVPAGRDTFPFCSPRCRTIDLGRWVDGRYRVSRAFDWENDDLSSFDPQ